MRALRSQLASGSTPSYYELRALSTELAVLAVPAFLYPLIIIKIIMLQQEPRRGPPMLVVSNFASSTANGFK